MLASDWQFSTEAYPCDSRGGAWRDALCRLSLAPALTEKKDVQHGQIAARLSQRGFLLARIVSGAQELTFASEALSASIWLLVHMQGEARLVDDGRAAPLATGDILFGPPGAAIAIGFRSDFQSLFVKIPLDTLRARLAAPLPDTVERLRRGAGIAEVFSRMLTATAASINLLSADDLRPLELTLVELLAASLGGEASNHAMLGETGAQTSTLHRICQNIETRLGDSEVALVDIAAEAGVSERYLQRLFEGAGTSFSRHLRRRRLERCSLDLINPRYAHLSISELCFRWGFNDLPHFSRAFREQYGVSPRAYRRELAAELPKLQTSRGWPTGPLAPTKRSAEKPLPDHRQTEGGLAALVRPSIEDAALPRLVSLPRHHHIPVNETTIHWGYFDRMLKPVLEVGSGDIVTIETLTQHASDDYARMIKGDPGAESVFHWTRERKSVERRGAGPYDASIYGRGAGEGFGVHICTGPIAVKGAESGDIIELRILDIRLRGSANPPYLGKAFGSNAATWWGYHYKEFLTEPKPREVVTIYEIDCADGAEWAKAVYNFRWTPQTDPYGVIHAKIDYPGVRVDHDSIVENHDVLRDIRIPVRTHFGVIALAPKETGMVDSIPPSYFGGNIDNWRAGKGARLYLPVSVPGGLLSIGDPHAAQGDAEICGTAIECSLTGDFQLVLHKRDALAGTTLADLNYPLLETRDEWILHGFSHANYLAELGEAAQCEIYEKSSLDPAMQDAFRKMRRFLMTAKGLTEDEAISLMSVAVDFGITQVVDGNWGVHAIIRKAIFAMRR